MNMEVEEPKATDKVFKRRLDFYWQFIAIYSVVLLLYALLKSYFIEHKLSLAITDPLSILFLFFVVITLIAVIYQEILKQEIIIGDDYIIFKSRFREKKYNLNNIIRISISKDRRIRVKKPVRIIKIRVKNRRLSLRIRPSAYWDDQLLANTLIKIKKKTNS